MNKARRFKAKRRRRERALTLDLKAFVPAWRRYCAEVYREGTLYRQFCEGVISREPGFNMTALSERDEPTTSE